MDDMVKGLLFVALLSVAVALAVYLWLAFFTDRSDDVAPYQPARYYRPPIILPVALAPRADVAPIPQPPTQSIPACPKKLYSSPVLTKYSRPGPPKTLAAVETPTAPTAETLPVRRRRRSL